MALTPYLRLNKPPFSSVPWDEAINGDLDIIDGFIAQYMSVPNFSGSWTNSTAYVVGQIALDTLNSSMWRVEVSHTSAAAPTTFAQDRTAHPTYWSENSVPQGFLPITGGTLLGMLTLFSDPTNPLHAATKAYADAGVRSWNGRTGAVSLGSTDVTSALGYTPYNGTTNPLNFQTGAQVAAALGSYYNTSTSDARYVYKSGDTVTGALTVNGRLTTQDAIMCASGIFYVGNNTNYFLQRATSDATWYWVENGTVNLFLTPSGNVQSRGSITAGTNVSAAGNLYAIGTECNYGYGGEGRILQMAPQCYFTLDGNSQLSWVTPIGKTLISRITPDHLVWNGIGTFGGFGPFIDLSDRRSKSGVTPTTKGLTEVLQLNPVTFQRIMPDGTTQPYDELGLVAQEVALIIPEVVTNVGIALADGEGTFDTGNPSQGIAYSPLVTVLINAIKELNARIVTLEAAVP